MRIARIVAAVLVVGALCFAAYDIVSTPHRVARSATTARSARTVDGSRAAERTPTGRAKESPLVPSVQRTLQQRFLETADLADFVARQTSSAQHGDGEAALYIAKAYEECMPFGKDPAAHVSGMRETLKPLFRSTSDVHTFDAIMEQEVSRCAALNQTPRRQKAMQDWLSMAAKQGSLMARITALTTGVTDAAPGEIQDILALLVHSKDGEAISAIGPLMGLTIPDEISTFKEFAGGQDDAYVWALAGCSFGADCSRSGDILRGMCESSGFCSFNSVEEAYSRILPPIEFEQIMKMREALVVALKKD